MDIRKDILSEYSKWTVLSALRRGAPISSKENIHPVVDKIDFSFVLDVSKGKIDRAEFDVWHKSTLEDIVSSSLAMASHYGWAAKIVNVYLKTYCYVGDGGRLGIRDCLHPPIDSNLWKGVKKKFKSDKEILNLTHSKTAISSIRKHEEYEKIVRGFLMVSKKLECKLIEVEQLWKNA